MRTLSRYISERDIIGMMIAALIGITLSGHVDHYLAPNYDVNAVPYGWVWAILNSFYWTQLPYKVYLLVFEAIWIIPQVVLVRRGKMNIRMLELYLLTTVVMRFVTNFQEVTKIVFLPLASINPLFVLMYFIQRYPFWSLIPSLSDPHAQCAIFGQCTNFVIDRSLFWTHSNFPIYVLEAVWLFIPLYVWNKRRKGQVESPRFWRWATLIILAILMSTFILQVVEVNQWWWWMR